MAEAEKPKTTAENVISCRIWPQAVNMARKVAESLGNEGLTKTVMIKIVDCALMDVWKNGENDFKENVNIYSMISKAEEAYWQRRTSDKSNQNQIKPILIRLTVSKNLLADISHAAQNTQKSMGEITARLIESFLFAQNKEARNNEVKRTNLIKARIAESLEKMVE